jgi:hypothetical protein
MCLWRFVSDGVDSEAVSAKQADHLHLSPDQLSRWRAEDEVEWERWGRIDRKCWGCNMTHKYDVIDFICTSSIRLSYLCFSLCSLSAVCMLEHQCATQFMFLVLSDFLSVSLSVLILFLLSPACQGRINHKAEKKGPTKGKKEWNGIYEGQNEGNKHF